MSELNIDASMIAFEAATPDGRVNGITGLIYPIQPRVGLFGVHDGKRFAGLLAAGEIFMQLHKNRLRLKFKMKGRVGALLGVSRRV